MMHTLQLIDDMWFLYGKPYTGHGLSPDNSVEFWCHEGQYHKDDGPAIIWESGVQEWWVHGKRHREDGPSLTYPDGTKVWFVQGKRHREDGPAIEWEDGTNWWFIHDNRINTWKKYHILSSLSPQEQMIVKLRYGEELK